MKVLFSQSSKAFELEVVGETVYFCVEDGDSFTFHVIFFGGVFAGF